MYSTRTICSPISTLQSTEKGCATHISNVASRDICTYIILSTCPNNPVYYSTGPNYSEVEPVGLYKTSPKTPFQYMCSPFEDRPVFIMKQCAASSVRKVSFPRIHSFKDVKSTAKMQDISPFLQYQARKLLCATLPLPNRGRAQCLT